MSSDNLTPQAAVLTAAFSSDQAAPKATPATTAPTAPAPPGPQGTMSAEHAKTMADWAREDVATGKLTPEQATKLFNELGVPLDQRGIPEDLRTAEQIVVDLHAPVAKPEDYCIRYGEPGQPTPPMTPALTQFDTDTRTWLVGAGFSRELGNSLISNIDQVVRATKAMTPGQLESYRLLEHAKMQRIYGDKLDEKLQAADDMIEQVEAQHSGLKERVWGRIGVGRNALIWNMLIGQAERWHARRKGR